MASPPRLLILILRRDLRLHDNPLFHHAHLLHSTNQITHLLPLYIFNPQQIEVSGLLSSPALQSPYPESRSAISGFWRCGPHRAKFIAEAVWDVKTTLKEKYGSDLVIRVGKQAEVVNGLLEAIEDVGMHVGGVWMAGCVGTEEVAEERSVQKVVEDRKVNFRRFEDGSYLYTERELSFDPKIDLPNVFTMFRKRMEPLRDTIPSALPPPPSLPPPPENIPPQPAPFTIPTSLSALIISLQSPILAKPPLNLPTSLPTPVYPSSHPFSGGETSALSRLHHLLTSGALTTYKQTRNSLLGLDFSTKLSGYLSLGCISARRIHTSLLQLENGLSPSLSSSPGFGLGENQGTGWLRFELCWRDYFALCGVGYGSSLFSAGGYRNTAPWWPADQSSPRVQEESRRWCLGTTGTGIVDASMRELMLTGWTSNRARQNAASYLGKRCRNVDWRVGAEWYEFWLVDYDPASNWGNWQYVSGVGNDPRGETRVFNQVKQLHDYDPDGEYVKAWVPELRCVLTPGAVAGTWFLSQREKEEVLKRIEEYGGERVYINGRREMVERPLVIVEGGRGGGNRGRYNGSGNGNGGNRMGKKLGEGRKGTNS